MKARRTGLKLEDVAKRNHFGDFADAAVHVQKALQVHNEHGWELFNEVLSCGVHVCPDAVNHQFAHKVLGLGVMCQGIFD